MLINLKDLEISYLEQDDDLDNAKLGNPYHKYGMFKINSNWYWHHGRYAHYSSHIIEVFISKYIPYKYWDSLITYDNIGELIYVVINLKQLNHKYYNNILLKILKKVVGYEKSYLIPFQFIRQIDDQRIFKLLADIGDPTFLNYNQFTYKQKLYIIRHLKVDFIEEDSHFYHSLDDLLNGYSPHGLKLIDAFVYRVITYQTERLHEIIKQRKGEKPNMMADMFEDWHTHSFRNQSTRGYIFERMAKWITPEFIPEYIHMVLCCYADISLIPYDKYKRQI